MKSLGWFTTVTLMAIFAIACQQESAEKSAQEIGSKMTVDPAPEPSIPTKPGADVVAEQPAPTTADVVKAPETITAEASKPDVTAQQPEVIASAPPKKVERKTGKDFEYMDISEVAKRQKRFVPVRIEWDQSLLTDNEKELVRTLVRAARVIDHIFWMQASPDGLEWRKKLAQLRDPESRTLFHYLMINYGAYDRLDDNAPFLGNQPKAEGANYYPTDMTKEEFTAWLEQHPEDEKAFKSTFTTIAREGDKLIAIPYSKAYNRELQAAHRLLTQASELAENASLKTYLKSRAEAFLSDDYYQSDVDWMDLDSKIEVTIGPYEVYEDHLFGYKAAFEAFVTVKDPIATARLDTFKDWLVKLEKNLPIPDKHKNFKRGASSPLPVVDVVFTAGDTRAGVQTIAYNLPNDERVREEKGSKKVMLRNVGMAKFHKILKPVARRVLAESKVSLLHQDAYFNHTLLHEISHGLGPGTIKVDGIKTTVNLALKELYPHLEEAKADILGLYNAIHLIDKGVIELAKLDESGTPLPTDKLTPEEAKEAVVATFLAGIFRSTRFGVEEAHGKANLVLFNYLMEKGGFLVLAEGRMDYDLTKIYDVVKECSHDILMLEALGDYEGTKAFIEKYGEVRPEMQAAWDSLSEVPVDIEPIYEIP
jgi:hypothetical protein